MVATTTLGRILRAALLLALLSLLGACASTSSAPKDDLPTSSDQTEIQRRAQIRLQLAVGYFEQGQMTTALDEVKQALQIDPTLSDAYSVRALIYMEMMENRLAEENFVQAMKLTPDNPDLANNFGWFLCQTGRADKSIAYFEKALANRQYASPSKALNNAGMCSLRMKNMAQAEKYLARAFQAEPGNPDVNLNLAKFYLASGDPQRGQFYSRRVISAAYLTADSLWTAIRIERRSGDKMAEAGLANQLRRRFPNSPEYAAYLRGAFDE
ncbi:type IV pilus biogenesis/stability protein PilW [Lacisediminimonas sp.]|uniref:type IV pilus biogenesis/stability protein PilW n=1 Tax=Lacisediminimonas sp. TaxID=3060582 RepID=UPI0027259130|nr:type IV pilus biogenesis/stability protein PilW [Lacisediminimonas sp.]MDO8301287.1 type IV pilus biogenesis/stability protein PilW [Lacisediminimonas sp.]